MKADADLAMDLTPRESAFVSMPKRMLFQRLVENGSGKGPYYIAIRG
jgi:hypothetical protein